MAIKTKGITLIEIMVVIGIFMIIMTTTVGLFIRSLKGVGTTETIIESEDSAQLAIAIMERNIKNARDLVGIGGAPCPATGSTLQLVGGDNGVTTFSLTDGRIASNSSFVTSPIIEISNLSFACTTNSGAGNQITISFTASYKTSEGSNIGTKNFTQTVLMRNL